MVISHVLDAPLQLIDEKDNKKHSKTSNRRLKMPRRKSNPNLVKELIDNLWNENYSQEKFEKNYNSLNSDDMWKVAKEIDKMEEKFLNGDDD